MSSLACSRSFQLVKHAKSRLQFQAELIAAQDRLQFEWQRPFVTGAPSQQNPFLRISSSFFQCQLPAVRNAFGPTERNLVGRDRSECGTGLWSRGFHSRSVPLHASTSGNTGTNRDEASRDQTAKATGSGAGSKEETQDASTSSPGSRFGQNFNLAGIRITLGLLLGGKKHLGVPHIAVPDVRWIDWHALKEAGFKGVVFDKDNTLTVPYALEVHAPLAQSLRECREAFNGKLVLLSNSAGLSQFDPDGKEAALLEEKLGIPVLRHGAKKPAGSSDALTAHFQCPADQLIMVGDRYFTDIVFGNRHGMLTIRPSPLTATGEPTMVKKVRLLEATLLSRWQAKGISAQEHALASVPGKFIKDPGCW